MIALIVKWLVSAVALIITSKLVQGFEIKSFGKAMVAVAVIGLINAVLKPILIFLTLPVTILTLGLFAFVISVVLLKLSASLVDGFEIEGWGAAFAGGLVLAITNAVLMWIVF